MRSIRGRAATSRCWHTVRRRWSLRRWRRWAWSTSRCRSQREFFGDEAGGATKRFFERNVAFFPFMATIDALQHYVYTHVDAGLEAWKDEYVRLVRRFSPEVDMRGLEAFLRQGWQKKLHVYEVPFYYVEYGIAQLGALQVWKNSLRDYAETVALYRQGLALGGARPLPELFTAAGLRFDFTEATLRPLIEAALEKIAAC